jgi:hypothetical protein
MNDRGKLMQDEVHRLETSTGLSPNKVPASELTAGIVMVPGIHPRGAFSRHGNLEFDALGCTLSMVCDAIVTASLGSHVHS